MEGNLGIQMPHLGSQIPRGLPPHAIRRNLAIPVARQKIATAVGSTCLHTKSANKDTQMSLWLDNPLPQEKKK